MARTDNLTNFLTDVATSIKEKKGDNTPIQASDFDTEIANLPSGGDVSEYFTESITNGISLSQSGWLQAVKKFPSFYFNGTSTSYMFARFPINSIDLSNFDTSNVTTMTGMFASSSLTSLDLSMLNTANVIKMNSMFNACGLLKSLNINNFDTHNVDDMSNMFYICSSLQNLYVNNFDTSNVGNMNSMFSNCSNLAYLNLSNFDTSKVTDMSLMFSGIGVSVLDLRNFNTSSLFSCSQMFYNCKAKVINVSGFDMSNVRNVNGMFDYCSELKELIIDNPNVFKLSSSAMFNNSSIKNGTGYVYVPDDLVESYKTATNWSVYASQIKPISELPEEVEE